MSLTFLEEDAGSSHSHDTLLHCETLSIVSTGNFENVAFVFLTKRLAVNFLAHSLLEEWPAVIDRRSGLEANASFVSGLKSACGTYILASSSTSINFWPPEVGSAILN